MQSEAPLSGRMPCGCRSERGKFSRSFRTRFPSNVTNLRVLSHCFILRELINLLPSMKNKLVVTLCVSAALAGSAWASDAETKVRVRAVVELKDGSRLVGAPLEESLPVTLDFMKASVPLEKIRQCEIRPKDERVTLSFQNGDKLTGTLELEKFSLETALGKLSPEIAQINRMTFTSWREGNMPPGEGSLSFGGVNWLAWKTLFEIQGDKLVSLPKARPGFNYGHGGNGRGPALMSNIGNSDWKDYRMECEFCIPGVNPSLNPHGLGLDFRGGAIFFHVVDAKESFNECGSSAYMFSVQGDGSWTLSCSYNDYCHTPVGWGNPRNDGQRTLGSGRGLKLDRENGNKFRLEVRGQHIQIWVDGEPVVDVTDEKMGETIGGKTLDHGGVGFLGGFDAMIWIRNFSATGL